MKEQKMEDLAELEKEVEEEQMVDKEAREEEE